MESSEWNIDYMMQRLQTAKISCLLIIGFLKTFSLVLIQEATKNKMLPGGVSNPDKVML